MNDFNYDTKIPATVTAWVENQLKSLDYGELSLKIMVHQGKVQYIEKYRVDKEKME